jgi:hypothetical protein
MAAAKIRMESDEVWRWPQYDSLGAGRCVIDINPGQIGVDWGQTEYLVDQITNYKLKGE